MSVKEEDRGQVVQEWKKEQERLSGLVETKDRVDEPIKLIGGADISFSQKDEHVAVAALVVCEYPSMRIVREETCEMILDLPYVPGFLAFREAPAVLCLLERLKDYEGGKYMPQVLLCDGNGILHARSCGLASHVGISFDLPTVGCAKKLYKIDGLEEKGVRERALKVPSPLYLTGKSGRTWGAGITKPGCVRPIYVSIGHRLSLDTAIRLVQDSCLVRVPEPVRRADLLSRRLISKLDRTNARNQ